MSDQQILEAVAKGERSLLGLARLIRASEPRLGFKDAIQRARYRCHALGIAIEGTAISFPSCS